MRKWVLSGILASEETYLSHLEALLLVIRAGVLVSGWLGVCGTHSTLKSLVPGQLLGAIDTLAGMSEHSTSVVVQSTARDSGHQHKIWVLALIVFCFWWGAHVGGVAVSLLVVLIILMLGIKIRIFASKACTPTLPGPQFVFLMELKHESTGTCLCLPLGVPYT